MGNIFGKLQKLGKALMLPIAVLPVASLFLRLGASDILDIKFIFSAGDAIFANLAILFAIGVAVGLAKNNAGAAALAGAVSYFVITTCVVTLNDKIEMGVLAGIIAGVVGGLSYNKFHKVKLPDFLGFFGGKRFVPIMASFISLGLAFVFGYVWPTIQLGIDNIGHWIIQAGTVGAFAYGFLNRLLIPVGLHHILNNLVWFVFGEYNGVTGDLNRFMAGDPNAGVFMAGFYPIMMFALPAVAFAMYRAAKPENRKTVAGAFLSVGFTAFLTGITEPIEFMFMFLAPVLYFIHAILSGLSFAVTNMLGIKHGFGFSAGLIDYLLSFGKATKPLLLIPVGLVFGAVYYWIFYTYIKIKNIPTPGREDLETIDDAMNSNPRVSTSTTELAEKYIKALGGKDNLIEVDACITRLRLVLKDASIVEDRDLTKLGASGVIRPNKKSMQVVVGTKAEIIVEEMKAIL